MLHCVYLFTSKCVLILKTAEICLKKYLQINSLVFKAKKGKDLYNWPTKGYFASAALVKGMMACTLDVTLAVMVYVCPCENISLLKELFLYLFTIIWNICCCGSTVFLKRRQLLNPLRRLCNKHAQYKVCIAQCKHNVVQRFFFTGYLHMARFFVLYHKLFRLSNIPLYETLIGNESASKSYGYYIAQIAP